MSLNDLLATTGSVKKESLEITEERLLKHVKEYRELINYWRMYPDRLIDYYCSLNPKNTFHLFFYQRLFLRVIMRHRYVYAVFVRAWSKSFMSVMALMLKAILYPGVHLFSVAGGKEQSAQILSTKVQEICALIPSMAKEIIWDTRGTKARTSQSKDTVIYSFKNGSTLQNIVAGEKSRGLRFQGGLMEECVSIDQNILETIIIPTMNIDRRIGAYGPKEDEPINKSQTYINFFGQKVIFLCQKLSYYIESKKRQRKKYVLYLQNWKSC